MYAGYVTLNHVLPYIYMYIGWEQQSVHSLWPLIDARKPHVLINLGSVANFIMITIIHHGEHGTLPHVQ